MKASTKRVLSLLGTAALFVGALIVYSVFLEPYYESINKLRGELVARKNALESQDAVIKGVKALLAEYEGKARVQDVLDETLPANESAATLVAQIEAITRGAGLSVQALSTQTGPLRKVGTTSEGAVGTVELSMRLVGSYESFKTFLDWIETNVRLMDITDWRAEPLAKNNANILVFSVTINAYYATTH